MSNKQKRARIEGFKAGGRGKCDQCGETYNNVSLLEACVEVKRLLESIPPTIPELETQDAEEVANLLLDAIKKAKGE